MNMLLTSAGIRNASIRTALEEMLGKPISEARALCIPTAAYGSPHSSPESVWRFISGRHILPMCEIGWKSIGVLELTALPSIEMRRWIQWIQDSDALLAGGGDAVFLAHWMRLSGLDRLLPGLEKVIWVGASAGSMVMTPRVGDDFVEMKPSITGDDKTLGIVDFSIFPHVDHPNLPENTMALAEQWAAGLGCPSYAIDDETAIRVVGASTEVISEGNWRYFAK